MACCLGQPNPTSCLRKRSPSPGRVARVALLNATDWNLRGGGDDLAANKRDSRPRPQRNVGLMQFCRCDLAA